MAQISLTIFVLDHITTEVSVLKKHYMLQCGRAEKKRNENNRTAKLSHGVTLYLYLARVLLHPIPLSTILMDGTIQGKAFRLEFCYFGLFAYAASRLAERSEYLFIMICLCLVIPCVFAFVNIFLKQSRCYTIPVPLLVERCIYLEAAANGWHNAVKP